MSQHRVGKRPRAGLRLDESLRQAAQPSAGLQPGPNEGNMKGSVKEGKKRTRFTLRLPEHLNEFCAAVAATYGIDKNSVICLMIAAHHDHPSSLNNMLTRLGLPIIRGGNDEDKNKSD